MVDLRLFINPKLFKKSQVVQRKCRNHRNEPDKPRVIANNNNNENCGEKPKLKKRYVVLALAFIIICACIGLAYHFGFFSRNKENSEELLVPPNPIKQLPPSRSLLHKFNRAAVCADGVECAAIGKSILEKNGSAVDATLATMFCNGIVTMQSMGLGGGFLMTIYIKKEAKAYTLNAREKAPINASAELYTDRFKSRTGPLSVAVPGELKGYWEAHKRFGKLPWNEIIEPTIDLCEKGYNMTAHQYQSSFKSQMNDNDTNFKEWFFDNNHTFKKAGSRIIPKKLCETLRTIAKNGGDELHNGSLTEKFVEDLREMGGILTTEDMMEYTAEWMEPMTINLKNRVKLYSMGLPGSGLLLGFIMNILDGFKFNPKSIDGIPNTIQTYHRIVEAFKYAYAKRTELGDTNFINITDLIYNLTSATYGAEIREKIKDNTTSSDPNDYGAVFFSRDDHGTAHISVLAENGDAVSVTSSINIYYGAGFTSKRTGIIYNSVMDDFSFPNFPNYFGLPGSPNNELRPGKRPLSSMTPSILVDENGDVKLVIGASGGTKITTAVALVIIRTLWFKETIKEATDAPRIHHQLFPMEISYEYGVLQQIVDGLEALGHKTSRYKDAGSIICALLKESNVIYANADYRKGGDVYGF